MDWLLLILCGLALFGTRDAFGLARFGDSPLAWLHAAAILSTSCGLGLLAEQMSRDEAQELLRNSALWGPALAMHAALWLAFQYAKRAAPTGAWPGMLFAIPSPLLIYSLGGAAWFTLLNSNLSGLVAGLVIGSVYVLAVLGAARILRARSADSTARTRAVEIGASANLAAFLLIPLHQESQESRLATYAIDWAGTAVALGATALLVGASFALHRWKRA